MGNGTSAPRGNLPRGEARTRRLLEIFPHIEEYTREEILGRLRQEGMIGSGLAGRLKGEGIIRRFQPSQEIPNVPGHYFQKNRKTGKYCLTYAGGE